jgi:hypothetical protein
MSTADSIKHELFNYFEARGVVAGHLVSIVDFADKMNPGHSAEELAQTSAAFKELVTAGVLEAKAADEYLLTAKGLDMLRDERTHHPVY